ncbi:hypothetical protein F5I97DRAFT_1931797 [Phlebopus sp. FC_14]|nr:hypothetical protein F5I97DRAFT_1931797 [Phlebopus sp. FC_14]
MSSPLTFRLGVKNSLTSWRRLVQNSAGRAPAPRRRLRSVNKARGKSWSSNWTLTLRKEAKPQIIKEALAWMEKCDELLEAAHSLESFVVDTDKDHKVEAVRASQGKLLVLLGQVRPIREKLSVDSENAQHLGGIRSRTQSHTSLTDGLEVGKARQDMYSSENLSAATNPPSTNRSLLRKPNSPAISSFSLSLARLRLAMEELRAPAIATNL